MVDVVVVVVVVVEVVVDVDVDGAVVDDEVVAGAIVAVLDVDAALELAGAVVPAPESDAQAIRS